MSAQPPTPASPNARTGVPQTTVALPTARLGEPVPQKAADRPSFGTGPDVCTQLSQTVSEMPAPGNITAAEVAPPKGPIDVPAETPVVVVAKHLWDSPTIKLARGIVLGALGVGLAYVGGQILAAKGITNVDWNSTLRVAVDLASCALIAAAMGYKKTLDNNPTVK